MKKLLSLLVATVMVLGMIVSIGILPISKAEAADVKDVTMIAAVWQRVGYDRFGRPLFNGQYTTYDGVSVNINGRFSSNVSATYDATGGVYAPWQSKDGEIWGRAGYSMPNCLTAISDRGLGRYNDAVTTASPATWRVTPYLYTEIFLTVKAKGGESQLFDKRYVIMDNMGVVWIDPDGKFNDCRFWDPANPTSSYYRSTVARSGDGSSAWNDCSTNPRMMVDPSGGNNTQGPYIFNSGYNANGTVGLPAPRYHSRIYYWWWDEDKNIDRVWRLGFANMTDYLRKDAFCADGVHRSSGIVGGPDGTTPGAYYPGKPVLWNSQIGDPVTQRWTANDNNIIAFDWDVNTGLSDFSPQEFFIDCNPMDGVYQPGEPIFLDTDANGFDTGDSRLVSYTIQWGGRAINFRENTIVSAVDEDYLWYVAGLVPPATLAPVQFAAIPPAIGFFKHANVTGINVYEQIYNDLDDDDIVDPGEIRISNINYRTNGFGPSSGFFFMGDVLIMLEVLKTSCELNYNIHVQSDLWTGMQEDTYQNPELIPSRTVAAFKSSNGDINSMAQLINKATTLDIDGKSFYMPTTTFFDVKALYREYLGIQIFCDNGIDNNMAQGGRCYSLSLTDDHVNFEAGELFVGATDVETAMDYNLPLTDIPAIYYYYETAVNMAFVPADLTFVEYGCGEPIYKDLNRLPLTPIMPLQEDYTQPNYNPPVVNAGDQRMTDVTVSASNAGAPPAVQDMVTYKAGSIVTPGDLDVGRPLTMFEAGMVFHDESQNCEEPNKLLDVGEYIYWDPTQAGSTRAVRMLGGPGMAGMETFTTGFGDFGDTTDRYAPVGTSPFASADPNRGAAWRRYASGYIPNPATQDFYYAGYNNQIVNISGTQFEVANPYDNRCMYDQYFSWGMPNPYPAGTNDGSPMGYENNWQWDRLSSRANDIGQTAWGNGGWYGSWITSYFPSSTMLMYEGLDTAGNSAFSWNSYSFNFDYEPYTNNAYTGWYFYMGWTGAGIAGVYLQSTGSAFTGYGLYWNYTAQNYGYSTIGLPDTDVTRLYLVRYTSSGNYSSMTPIDFRDYSGDRFSYQLQSIRSTVIGNQWRITIPSLGPQFTLNLTGGNTNGSVGFPNWTNQQSYWDNNNEVYWDNVDVFYTQFVPSFGDRRRMTNPGHWVGQNNYVMRKNAEGDLSTSSTSAKSDFKPFGYWYPCGTKLTAGEIYDVESKIGMVTMGQNGDPRYMDIEVLPGKVKVNIDIDGKPVQADNAYHLKVEQTSDVRISVDPPPAPGEKYVVKATDVFQSGIPASPAHTDYVETAEANSFTEFERNEIAIPKESFNTIYGLGHWYGYIVTDCAPVTGSGGFPCPQLAMPFDFPFYDTVVPAGTHIQAYVAGYITFDNLQNYCGAAGSYPYPGTTWGWFTQAPNWVIAPCAVYYQSLGSSPLWPPAGDYPINPNLNMFVANPTPSKIKIRWATCYEYDYPNYPYPYRATPVNVAQYNYSVTLDSAGTIRFSYGEFSGNGPNYYQACVGIKRTGNTFHQAVHHAKIVQELAGADDVLLTLTNFAADPGRPSGGTIEGNYLVGSGASSLDVGAQSINADTSLGHATGNISAKILELTAENPIQHFQVTPYRGSCQPDGSRDPYKIEVFLERGGLTYPVPMDSVLSGERVERPIADYENVYDVNIYDPYWVARPWTIRQYDNRYPGDKTPLPIPSPSGIPTYSCALDDQYDCFGRFNLNVAPEDLTLIPNRCLSPLDLRYPNLVLKVFDGDNPFDINDPAGMQISTTSAQPGNRAKLVANVNANGAGIKYLCMARNPQGDDYVIQVNESGTYTFWRLYEPQGNNAGAAEGILDPTDWLYSTRNTYPRGSDDPQQPYYPTRLPWQDSDGFVKSMAGGDIGTELDDRDCSIGQGLCDVCHLGEGFPRLGDITPGDRMGRFNGNIVDLNATFLQGYNGYTHGVISSFGVKCMITNWTNTDIGGEIMVPLQAQNAESPVTIRVYLDGVIYDYNSALATFSMDNSNPTIHPPYFIYDDAPGIDYCGTVSVKVTPAAELNFSEFRFVDNALRSSKVNYTAGTGALSLMDRPSPQLMSWYDPICYNNKRDCVAYPGGQSHVQRAVGVTKKGGFNAYPAIQQSLWRKLGTEFYPMADYSMYFALTAPNDSMSCQGWDQYTFNAQILQSYPELQYSVLRSIEITGPFITPYQYARPEQLWDGSVRPRARLTSEYSYNGIKNVPIKYDLSGKITIDSTNYQSYEFTNVGSWYWTDGDWTNILDPATDFDPDRHSRLRVALPSNGKLRQHRDLVYNPDTPYIPMQQTVYNTGMGNVFVVDGIIPIQPGNIQIKVTLNDGSEKIYQDCCPDTPTDGIDVHALKIELGNEDIEQRGTIFVDKEVTFNVKLTEDEKASAGREWEYKECNDALVYAWQDRGVFDPDRNIWDGAGDGWCSNPPKSSDFLNQGVQFQITDDRNKDGKVAFANGETEIMGTYDFATNTWYGAFIDARTFQRNDGIYNLPVMTDTVGFDFGGIGSSGRPLPPGFRDHVVGEDELLPVWIVAYKYGDDDNDRSFRPLYNGDPNGLPEHSHEVYMAGTRAFEVTPNVDLQVTYGPEPLTAGMTPELQDPSKPLTFTVKDSIGNNIDLTKGVKDGFGVDTVLPKDMQMHLFNDPHPDNAYYYGKGAKLPQYYWLRTDLQNYSMGLVNNMFLYSMPNDPFTPIKFSKNEGNYIFRGFCANDQGEFDVYVYTPDRRHSGVVTVKVKQPHVEYEVRNVESGQVFHVRGNSSTSSNTADPDFVMTALDNRLYSVTVTAWDAQGSLIKGIAQDVSVCSGSGQDTARFTAYVTRPQQWNMALGGGISSNPGVAEYIIQYNYGRFTYDYFMVERDNSGRFRPMMGVDINNDGKINPTLKVNDELHLFNAMGLKQMYRYGSVIEMGRGTGGIYKVHFNTTNYRYDDYSYELQGAWDIGRQSPIGWGYGAIYNNPYKGGYVFADLNADTILTFQDSLSFNQNGKVSFFFYADDILDLGGLVGNNAHSNDVNFSDLYGCHLYYLKNDPNYIHMRFRHSKYAYGGQNWYGTNDGVYRLDWDTIPDNDLTVRGPIVKVFDPGTGEEAPKELINPELYDLTWAVNNHIIARVYPADPRDEKMKTGTRLTVIGDVNWAGRNASTHEHSIFGVLQDSEVDPKAIETAITMMPTGTGQFQESLWFYNVLNWHKRYNNIDESVSGRGFTAGSMAWLAQLAKFDVAKGLAVKAEPYNKVLKLGQPDTVLVTVTEAGSGYRYEGAKVTMKSEDGAINLEGKTNQAGEAIFNDVKPESDSKIIVKATLEGRVSGSTVLYIGVDLTPPSINLGAIPSITNKKTLTIDGDVTKGSTLKVGNVNATVDANGKWKATINLVEGENMLNVIAVGPNSAVRAITIKIILDTVPPKVTLPTDEELLAQIVETGKFILSGRVEPGSDVKVKVNIGGNTQQYNVTVVNDFWTIQDLPATPGQMDVIIDATDAAGNAATPALTKSYVIPKVTTLKLIVGNTTKIVNGKLGTLLIIPPAVSAAGMPMIPVEELQADLGFTLAVSGNNITFTVGSATATCTIGSTVGTLNGNSFTLTEPPVLSSGKALVPASFFEKVLAMNTKAKVTLTYEPSGRVILIRIVE